MTPRGFTRCNECEGHGVDFGGSDPCGWCDGSGLVPTEKLREAAIRALYEAGDRLGSLRTQADAVLRKVAEHLGGGE